MFLVRTVFWLSIVIILIPGDPESNTQAPRVSLLEALSSVRVVAADFTNFCQRNPDVCVTGGAALQALADKAQSSARMLFGYLDGAVQPLDVDEQPGTLKESDRAPAWQGPDHSGTI
jgi:Family of unknown function (DUF5330)